jgi:hypothetical protein
VLVVEGDMLAVALADGHGHAKGVRADSGARIAVDAALDLVGSSCLALRSADGARGVIASLPTRLAAVWTERVGRHLASFPLSDGELSRVAALEGPRSRRALEVHPEIAYGTTLILAVAAGGHLVVAQLGDGDLLVVDRVGKVMRPFERDPELVGNRTWSLASKDAAMRCKTSLVPEADHIDLILAATDGYANSYASATGFDQVATDVLAVIRDHGVAVLGANLPAWLEATSDHGSGDDITVAILARGDATLP